ncbi:AAA family ATPase [Oceanicola sp. S124]|uniref:AAA family ATPase n=1 Tax=Oceanicola sp. S124 TaxID=1042378 RepID=UPI0002559A2C|nr:AAA family ATPase [Oceanicola sp. S124]
MRNFHVISGCSGGGKSTLLEALRQRGAQVVPEPGRRIVEAERDPDSPRLPWNDLAAFAEAAITLALEDLDLARALPGPVFFDRGLVDAVAARWQARGAPEKAATDPLLARRCYAERVFLTPPWPQIHVTDATRPHGLAEAIAEHERLAQLYPALDHEVVEIPRASLGQRVDFIVNAIG